ncbi:SDR family NAD(P)-dependent oxidoreductase [Vibrio sp. T187]|uniref:SDR family NAD(P)-dependent oxidoreductase n=1 Tax=Vibrio TaxID=662 RepID=UPI0010C9EB0F|nr:MULTISPECIES: SDR family NAD(P)-dependent oxidoreductase [Vibrio]MBW3695280.1 SDR family NAD(P)-dependent oxidoreductase [Vibrio sp. T187]
MLKSILITGANAGLGRESARQLALVDGTEKIYLGCRNLDKAKAAKHALEQETGKNIFEILIIDVANTESVKAAVSALKEPVEGLVMNAGGAGGKEFNQKTSDGVIQQFAVNVLGHVVLTEELLKANKLTKVAVYAGSEAARGVKEMGMETPNLKTSSIDEFASICDGSFFGEVADSQIPYGPTKYMGALWMSSIARQYPEIRFVTMSPGGTKGTQALESLPTVKKWMFQGMLQMMSWFGKVHKVEVGAKRFVNALLDDSYKSGVFYGSKSGISGPLIEQSTLFPALDNAEFQDNANQAIHRFIH